MAYEYGSPSRPIREILTVLRDDLARTYREEYLPAHRRSPRKSRRLRRIRGWSRHLSRLVADIDRVMDVVLPRIERETGHTFRDHDGIVRVLMSPSTERLFLGILGDIPEDALNVPARDLAILAHSLKDARALAIIGDVTLQLKVMHGEHPMKFASLADRWGLHENRIGLSSHYRPTGETLMQEKEALARATLGLIYIEGGADALRAAVPLLS